MAKGQPDALKAGTDTPSLQMDALNVSNRAETNVISHGDNLGTYLDAGDAKHIPDKTDGISSHADMLSWHSNVASIALNVDSTANMPENVRMPRKKVKLPDIHMEAAWQRSDKPNGCKNHADVSSARTDSQTVGDDTNTAGNVRRNIRVCQNNLRMQNSLYISKPRKIP